MIVLPIRLHEESILSSKPAHRPTNEILSLQNSNHISIGTVDSNMHPVVLVITLLAALATLYLPKKHALVPLIVVAFLTPFGQQLMLGGLHFYAQRIVIIAGMIRLLRARLSSKLPLIVGGLQPIDKAIFALIIVHATAYILLYRNIGAISYESAFVLEAAGGYLFCRYCISDRQAVLQVSTALAIVAALLSVCMGFESLTRENVFSYINSYPIVPWIRLGRVRAQGTFANSITSSTFGATLFPLFFWLWKGTQEKLLGAIGLVASVVIVVASMSGTGIMTLLGGMLALCLWPVRKYMRGIRWGVVVTVLLLALVMKAPVWFIIARFDVIGGHGWDRAHLIDLAVRHFFDWALLGTKDNATWGFVSWDQCDEFVFQAESGGIACFILFMVIISRGFGMIGRARKRVEGRRQEWFFWCLGAVLFAHVMGFWGIDYFDRIRVWWYLFLAMIPAATMAIRAPATQRSRAVLVPDPVPLVYAANSIEPDTRSVQSSGFQAVNRPF